MNILKNMKFALILGAAVFACAVPQIGSANEASLNKPVVIRTVNFKSCVENSKLGKQEQANFEALKKQMENILAEKEKTLNEIAEKFEDPDYLDSLSPEAETEIKRNFRHLNQELTQLQQQYYQALSQTNMKVVQKLTDVVNKAADTVAKQNGYDLILNEESYFHSNPDLDVSSKIVVAMDQLFDDAKAKEKETAKPAV